jgi:F-type H+-transporting ATPase subunit delta
MRDSGISSEIVTPYAQALMSVAKSHNLTDRFGDDMAAVLALLDESQDLQTFLASPLIKGDDKKAVLRQLLADEIHPYAFNFLMLLVDKGRVLFLAEVCKQYQALLRELKQTVLAEVTSAVELTDDQQESVRQKVIEITNARQVELETQIDPDLIGGVIIKVGSKVIDASLRGQLRRIGVRLMSDS